LTFKLCQRTGGLVDQPEAEHDGFVRERVDYDGKRKSDGKHRVAGAEPGLPARAQFRRFPGKKPRRATSSCHGPMLSIQDGGAPFHAESQPGRLGGHVAYSYRLGSIPARRIDGERAPNTALSTNAANELTCAP